MQHAFKSGSTRGLTKNLLLAKVWKPLPRPTQLFFLTPHPHLRHPSVCKVDYAVTYVRKLACDTRHALSATAIGQVCEILGLIFVTAMMVVVMLSLFPQMRKDEEENGGAQDEQVEENSKASTIIIYILWSITLILTAFTLRRHYLRWRAASYTRVINYASRARLTADERRAEAAATAAGAAAAASASESGAVASVPAEDTTSGVVSPVHAAPTGARADPAPGEQERRVALAALEVRDAPDGDTGGGATGGQ